MAEFQQREERVQQVRINARIRVPEVRVINSEGEQLGVMATMAARKLAEDAGLDLVEVSPRAFPPVCRIMDWGKYQYLQAKKETEGRKAGKQKELKELKVHPKTGQHDIEYRITHAKEFLEAGHKVRVTCSFKGREMMHPEIGRAHLDLIAKAVIEQGVGTVELGPRMEGKNMILIFQPKR